MPVFIASAPLSRSLPLQSPASSRSRAMASSSLAAAAAATTTAFVASPSHCLALRASSFTASSATCATSRTPSFFFSATSHARRRRRCRILTTATADPSSAGAATADVDFGVNQNNHPPDAISSSSSSSSTLSLPVTQGDSATTQKSLSSLTTVPSNNSSSNNNSQSESQSSNSHSQTQTPPLLRFARLLCMHHWRLLLPAIICAVIASVCAILEPLQFGSILAIISTIGPSATSSSSAATIGAARRRLLQQVGVIVVTYFVELVTTAIFLSLAARAIDNAIRALRKRVFSALFSNDVTFFDTTGRARVERDLTLQLRVARQAFWDNLSEDRGLRAMLEALLGVIMCIRLVGPIGIPFFCVFIPAIALFVAKLGMKTGRLNARVEASEADIAAFVGERVRGLRTVKAFGAELHEVNNLSGLLDEAKRTTRMFVDTKAGTACANRFNIYVTIIAFFVAGGALVSSGAMSFETFSSLVGFIWVLNFSMQGLLFTFTDASKMSVALRHVFDTLDNATRHRAVARTFECDLSALPAAKHLLRPVVNGAPSGNGAAAAASVGEDTVKSGAAVAAAAVGHVRFDQVTFRYPSRPDIPVLDDVSFDIRPGQTVALVGESGGGKSTIAALLCRFYEPANGTITLDGIDIRCIPQTTFSHLLSVVDQEPFLFTGTIRDNIAYGISATTTTTTTITSDGDHVLEDSIPDDADIMHAAKMANAHEFITALPNGYDTVWNPGSNLSGGQRQRIAIARSLLKRPRILVLDEATSALDQQSEQAVQAALQRIMSGTTTLIIAHRLSTIRQADVVLVVKQGRIVQQGSYDELYNATGGAFRALVDSGAGGNVAAGELNE